LFRHARKRLRLIALHPWFDETELNERNERLLNALLHGARVYARPRTATCADCGLSDLRQHLACVNDGVMLCNDARACTYRFDIRRRHRYGYDRSLPFWTSKL
jgi:hypothetical protein